MRFIIPIFFLIYVSFEQAPKSRQSILMPNDGHVMPPGALADLDVLNYDMLVQNFIGAYNNAGI